MRRSVGEIAPSMDVDVRAFDHFGGERQDGLLSRLKNQNSALEKLRHALDADDDEFFDVSMAAVGNTP